MGRVCTICTHRKRKEIDEAIVLGDGSNRPIASRFGVGYKAIERHRAHIAPKIAKAAAEEGRTLAGLVSKGHAVVNEVLDVEGDPELRLKAVDRLVKLADLEFGRSDRLHVTGDLSKLTPEELARRKADLIERATRGSRGSASDTKKLP